MTMEVVVSCHLSPSASSKNEWKHERSRSSRRFQTHSVNCNNVKIRMSIYY